VASQLAEEQRDRQIALATLLEQRIADAWQLLVPTDLVGTLPRLIQVLAGLIGQYGQASAVIAADYYTAERKAASAAGRFTPRLAPPPDLQRVTEAVQWSTHTLWADPANTDAAQTLTAGVVEQLALQAGRATIHTAVDEDRQAVGWARIPNAGACSFCLLLATRGGVYKSEATALRTTARSGRGEDVSYHDNCRCTAEVLFDDDYELSADVQRWEQVYIDSTRGKSGTAARNAFRIAVAAARGEVQ
jgi:hypothetical protein